MLGKTSYTVEFGDRNIFPEAIREIESKIGKKFMIGRYEATLLANYGQDNNLPLTASVAFWVFPWRLGLLIGLALVAIILGLMYWRKKGHNGTNKPTETSASRQPTQPDTPPQQPQS